MAFWDTSALVKLYVPEPDSSQFRQLMRVSAEKPIISQLVVAEMHRTLWAKQLARAVPANHAEPTYREFLKDIESGVLSVIPFAGDVQREFDRIVQICYRTIPVVPIRTLDGLLVASALVAGTALLISTDKRQRKAATRVGLQILPD
jgi:predicted nucleic acid-binding protein